MANGFTPLGKIVRVAPNKLSIATADSWKEVYGFNPTKPRFLKGSFYRAFGRRTSLFTETDPVIHGKMRKLLSHAFSPEAILQHEGIVHEHVKKFIGKLRGISEKRKPFEMSTWFHFLAFDIIGDLAFGEPFGSLDSGMFDIKSGLLHRGKCY